MKRLALALALISGACGGSASEVTCQQIAGDNGPAFRCDDAATEWHCIEEIPGICSCTGPGTSPDTTELCAAARAEVTAARSK